MLSRTDSGQTRNDAEEEKLDISGWRRTATELVAHIVRPANRQSEDQTAAWHPTTPARSKLSAWMRAMRPHQWVKNLLVLLPLIASHRIVEVGLLAQATVLLAAFCLCASSIYVVNDLLDRDADRRHATKRRRPFAAGELTLAQGVVGAALLMTAGLGLATGLGVIAFGSAAAYVTLTFAYSIYFKKRLALDAFFLAGLYVFRVVAGGLALGVPLSHWLLGFCGFFFLSLSFVKRFVELRRGAERGLESAPGRAYLAIDRDIVAMQGSGAGLAASVLLTLYVASDSVKGLYASPELLWAWVPMLLYWQCRIWTIANRGHMHDDPVLFAVRDKVTYAIALAFLVILALAATCDTSAIFARSALL